MAQNIYLHLANIFQRIVVIKGQLTRKGENTEVRMAPVKEDAKVENRGAHLRKGGAFQKGTYVPIAKSSKPYVPSKKKGENRGAHLRKAPGTHISLGSGKKTYVPTGKPRGRPKKE